MDVFVLVEFLENIPHSYLTFIISCVYYSTTLGSGQAQALCILF